MTAKLVQVGRDLAAAEKARAEMSLKHQEFLLACQSGEWDRAEAAREQFMAYAEAHLDAFMRGCKRANGAG